MDPRRPGRAPGTRRDPRRKTRPSLDPPLWRPARPARADRPARRMARHLSHVSSARSLSDAAPLVGRPDLDPSTYRGRGLTLRTRIECADSLATIQEPAGQASVSAVTP